MAAQVADDLRQHVTKSARPCSVAGLDDVQPLAIGHCASVPRGRLLGGHAATSCRPCATGGRPPTLASLPENGRKSANRGFPSLVASLTVSLAPSPIERTRKHKVSPR